MRGEVRSRSIFALAALGVTSVAACAQVFGLDEPTVREDDGATSATIATATAAAGQTTASTATSTSPGSGGGPSSSNGGGPGSGGEAPGSGGQGGQGAGGEACDTPDDCDDDNPCTDDSCLEGTCLLDPLPNGPLVEDTEDCRAITCLDGAVSDVADDSEDPEDANFPCETTICVGGARTPVFAKEGFVCGQMPQVCDGAGLCVGCDPAPPDDECGADTGCSQPSCVEPGFCDRGYLDAGTPTADLIDGDCQSPHCTGDSGAPISGPDNSDVPPDLPCGDRGCSGGAPTTSTLAEGQPCLGELGVCDGLGTTSSSCKACRDTTVVGLDAGCTTATPNCAENLDGGEGSCRQCVTDSHCEMGETGDECLSSYICGCFLGNDCSDAANGGFCRALTNSCGCEDDIDCANAARGENCINGSGICGCNGGADCNGAAWGKECLAGACGCNNDGDCEGADTCNLVTHRCED